MFHDGKGAAGVRRCADDVDVTAADTADTAVATCAECGFDGARWNQRDCQGFFAALGSWWARAVGDRPEPPEWTALGSGDPSTGEGIAAAHRVSHHMYEVARSSRSMSGTPVVSGVVEQINVSKGGVPKHPVPAIDVSSSGVVGDVQKERRHHGRQFQALSLWSAEVIEELAAAGHPIAPGQAGENLTVRGIDWAVLRPGMLLRIGSVLAELSFVAVPCKKLIPLFSDGDFRRISEEHNPHWVRWYAWVREPGTITVGDRIDSVRA